MGLITSIKKKIQEHQQGHCGCGGHGDDRGRNTASTNTEQITKHMIVREVADRWPQTVAVFGNHKVDFCCGGAHSIEQTARARLRGRSHFGAAKARGCQDIDALVADLNRAIR